MDTGDVAFDVTSSAEKSASFACERCSSYVECQFVCHRVLSEARSLRALPSLNGTARLRTLRVDRARLPHLPADLCAHAPQLRSL